MESDDVRQAVRAMLREKYASECMANPLLRALRKDFERDLESLVDKTIRLAEEDVRTTKAAEQIESILSARGRRDARIGEGEMRIVVSRVSLGVHRDAEQVGEILIGAPASATEHDVLVGLAMAIRQVVLDSSPIPRLGRVAFQFRGRTVQYGGDPVTDEVACDLAQDLLGVK